MTEYDARFDGEAPPLSGWAVGGITFAGTMMIMLGVFHVLDGIAAIANDEFFVATRNYAFDLDVTAWGWFHLVLGVVAVVAGFFLFAGRAWASAVAIAIAVLSAILNFFFIPYYPWWSLLIIALDVWVIWAVTRPGAESV
jgi:hypothetical protein